MTQALIEDLQWRGLINQASDLDLLGARLDEGSCVLYCGFDPTADSLHIGSLVPLLTLKRFQDAGHAPIALVGGATGLIGDPSFKADERSLNEREVVEGWVARLRSQVSNFIDLDAGGRVADNLEWTQGLDVISFLRDVGKHFSVNDMMRKEMVRERLANEGQGISFTEFSYMLLQSLDFVELSRRFDCMLQIGGSDQWGNITAGMELTRRMLGKQVHAMTLPLVTKADGTKFGKTETGTVWLDARRTSPYAFYQFWLNSADADVSALLRYFTFLSREEIEALDLRTAEAPQERAGQRALAESVTRLVHGDGALASAQRISEALFSGSIGALQAGDLAQLAQDGLPSADGGMEGLKVGQALCALGLAKSNSAAMQLIKSGAVSINGQAVANASAEVASFVALDGGYRLIRRGKRNWGLLTAGA